MSSVFYLLFHFFFQDSTSFREARSKSKQQQRSGSQKKDGGKLTTINGDTSTIKGTAYGSCNCFITSWSWLCKIIGFFFQILFALVCALYTWRETNRKVSGAIKGIACASQVVHEMVQGRVPDNSHLESIWGYLSDIPDRLATDPVFNVAVAILAGLIALVNHYRGNRKYAAKKNDRGL